ncbi:alpha/beta fold hydrolase [Catellatospora citrea]|uniref:Alpha/beta hydrolase n=2 Tax=Catellatospora citrea TaxID=53366 RepID=A0A8J3KBI1_9ACTN|nr:alpha/beta hydrolase [Catellatospora citrea]RKE05487.1 pimeloyl-ACP methyl ester carboxylesterase [Catellatospora citrea]GIG00162.1 alpha/beta hydrolase [Catellatospora citrea]
MNRRPRMRLSWAAATALGAMIGVAASIMAGSAATSASPVQPQQGLQPDKPTVVLVHGAFADATSWNGVIERLRAQGYPVVAPANPLRGLASDAAYVRSVLDSVQGPIVLAGHSYGGTVMSSAAAGDPDVKALVYIAAFAPEVGESTGELANKFPGNTLGANLKQVPYPLAGGGEGTDLYVKPEAFHEHFAADVPAQTAALMAITQRPAATTALEGKATEAAWKTIPSWALLATDDKAIPLASQKFMAERAKSKTVEVKASHAVAVSQPGPVADLIMQAAEASK